MLISEPPAPALGSGAPYTTRWTRASTIAPATRKAKIKAVVSHEYRLINERARGTMKNWPIDPTAETMPSAIERFSAVMNTVSKKIVFRFALWSSRRMRRA